MKTRTAQAGKAFSLVELLVVIAVIAILAALTLPSLRAAKHSADLATCRNNLRQLSIGLAMYTSEREYFPIAHDSHGTWITRLMPYVKMRHLQESMKVSHLTLSNTVFACPGFKRLPGTYLQDASSPYGYNSTGVDRYAAKGLGGDPRLKEDAVPVRESQVLSPSQMIALGDCSIVSPSGQTNNINPGFVSGLLVLAAERYPGSSAANKYYERRHTRTRWNLAFVDSHVETGKLVKILDGGNPAVRRRFNRDFEPH